MIPIIIVQPIRVSLLLCRTELSRAGFREGEDFALFDGAEAAEEYIIPNKPQLLVCGTFNGDNRAPADFVRRMSVKNPGLIIGIFSVSEIKGCSWKWSIIKADQKDFCVDLIPKLREFLGQKKVA